jgi:hypothetical protein
LASLLLNPAGIILPCLRKVNAMSGQLFSQTDENVQFNDAAWAEKRPRLGSESNGQGGDTDQCRNSHKNAPHRRD